MRLIKRKPIDSFESKKDTWRKQDVRRKLSVEKTTRFQKWLVRYKKYQIHFERYYHGNKKQMVVFWYQETPISPKITLELDPNHKGRRRLHVLGNAHLEEFETRSCATEKSRINIGEFYREYIKSDKWRDRSLRCFADADNQCEVCGNPNDLNAHHYNYHNLAKESKNDLFCLCRQCHGLYHRKYPASELPSDYDSPRLSRLHHIMGTVLQMMKRV